MAKVYQSATDLIGNTPLLEVTKLEKSKGLEAKVLIKLEYFNTRKCKRPCCILHGKRCRGERSFKGRFRDH